MDFHLDLVKFILNHGDPTLMIQTIRYKLFKDSKSHSINNLDC